MKKLWYMGLVFCLGVSILAGCDGEKTVDYDMEENTAQTQTEKNDSYGTIEQFADISNEIFKNQYIGVSTEKYESVSLNLTNAWIVLPETKSMSVVNAKEIEFDSAYKKKLAQKIFSGEEISDYDVKRDSYKPADGYEGDCFLGKWQNIPYFLSFSDDIDEWSCRSKEVILMPQDIGQVCPADVSGVEDLYYDIVDFEIQPKNQCTLSEEEAKEAAASFLGELDFESMVFAGVEPLAWWKGTNVGTANLTYIAYGYVISYDLGLDGVSFVASGVQENYGNMIKKKTAEGAQYNMKSRLEIMVTEKGVIGMHVYNPVEITGLMEADKLLSLETMLKIVKNEVERDPERFRFDLPSNVSIGAFDKNAELSLNVTYDEVELLYFRVRDKENAGEYMYVPTWRISDVGAFGNVLNRRRIDNPILINAIDGSVIDFYDEA